MPAVDTTFAVHPKACIGPPWTLHRRAQLAADVQAALTTFLLILQRTTGCSNMRTLLPPPPAGLNRLEVKRQVSTIAITLSTQQLDTSHPGTPVTMYLPAVFASVARVLPDVTTLRVHGVCAMMWRVRFYRILYASELLAQCGLPGGYLCGYC